MTEKLYYNDQYIRSFNANIVNIKEKDNEFHVILDKTAFFPGGGGQSCDLGTIDGCPIIDIYEERDNVVHVLKERPNNSNEVKCELDWNLRFDGMQQHLGQHVLSGCFYSLFNINTCGIHLGTDISTVDLIGEVTEQQIMEAEIKANEIIYEGHNVEFIFTNRREAKSMGLRRDLATKDTNIRVVKIEDLDINACCGIHPNNTKELQLIKIKRYEKHKGNTRIEFLAGRRAVRDYLKRDKILDQMCNYLSSGDEEVIKTVKNLNESIRELRDENIKIKSALSEYEIKELKNNGIEINDCLVIKNIYEEANMKYLTRVANKLVEENNIVVLFANKEKDKGNLLFTCSKNIKNLHMGNLLKDSVTLIDGKGGGSNVLAQGGGKNVANIENAIEYTLRKVSGLLTN